MKKNQSFLGSIFGKSIYVETTDKILIKQIGNYLERARQALMEKEDCKVTHTCDKQKCKNEYCLYKNGSRIKINKYEQTKIYE